MINFKNIMLFNPKMLIFIVSGFPATGVWFAWYFEAWNLMVSCLLLAVPIMIIDACLNRSVRARFIEIAALMLFYLPLVIYSFAKLYEERGLLHNGETIHTFTESLYFSIVTWTTLGYGDYQPSKSIILWAATEAFFGYLFMALLIALFMKFITLEKKNA